MLKPFNLIPIYRDFIWDGKRLRPEAEVAELEGKAFLGHKVVAKTGNRFPLLIKLLDCSKWLFLNEAITVYGSE
jgi:hypothetical protein